MKANFKRTTISIVVFITMLSLSLMPAMPVSSAGPEEAQSSMIGTPTPQPRVVREEPPQGSVSQSPFVESAAAGYCTSSGGSTYYEYINNVSITKNQNDTYKLNVDVYIANPNGCTTGSACPVYDESPEYVNAWIDWNGNKNWENSERVMDQALTGYLAINYFGTMSAVTVFSPPASATGNPTWMRVNLGWGNDPNDPCQDSWAWGNVVDQEFHLNSPKIELDHRPGIEDDKSGSRNGQRGQAGGKPDCPYRVSDHKMQLDGRPDLRRREHCQ